MKRRAHEPGMSADLFPDSAFSPQPADLFPGAGSAPKRRRRSKEEVIKSLLRLNEAAQQINSILDLDTLLNKVVSEVALVFDCSLSEILLKDEDTGDLVVAAVAQNMEPLGSRYRIGKDGMVGQAAFLQQMYYAPDVRQDPHYIADVPETLSEVDIPLKYNGELIGVFSAQQPRVDAFSPEQLHVLQALADHIAVAIHNARLFQRERAEKEEARLIQQTLFPSTAPRIPGFSLEGQCVTAGAVGGDWFDYMPLAMHRAGNDRLWGLVLADVSGKGTPAALLMSATRGMLRALVGTIATPAAVLQRLNRVLCEDFPPERFVTMIYAVLDAANRTFTFANAGHPWPIFAHDGQVELLQTSAGLPLGVADCEYDERTVELPPDSRILLYSDGVTEAGQCEANEYGLERLREHVLHRDASASAILREVSTFCGGGPLCDDATVIVLQRD